ncbi:carbon-nitrogen family hydrolase [Aliarcobacter cryaerophilus]|uniref:carbon-nitrogen family hydrolase n=1 Tax=Aliarcobacter cryaerophilus TaxID=28198 RepID=UPI003DA28638
MKIALVSLNQIWEDKKSNLDLCEKYIQEASEQNVYLIIFPEMTLTGFSNNINFTAEKFEDSETIKQFSNLAKKFNIAIVFGVVIEDNEKALNKSIFVNNFGNILTNYSKIHPFSFSGEDKYFNAGNKLSVVEFKDFQIGLTICYDLRFPELYSSLAKESDLIVNIANWPVKRVDHWNTLLKARAIENQIFIAGVNRTGIDGNDLEYLESSNIFNPNGEELEFEKYEDMKIYDIDVNFMKDFKNKFNTVNDRKIEFYKEIL